MSVEKLTTSPTESDLEAEIQRVIMTAFPWLSAGSIRHQTKFSFKFGRKLIEVDGITASRSEARSDIILYDQERPLAVLELKRKGVALTADDSAQGLSYARVLNPTPPLAIVTNGSETQFLETHSGKSWKPIERSEQTFKALVDSAAQVAAVDLKVAIDTLMGSNASVWMQAVRFVSDVIIEEMTSSVDQPALPFAKDFLLPRRACFQLLESISGGMKLTLLDGAPLSGKSNVLRFIVEATKSDNKMAIMYVEAGTGKGVLQSLADALSHSLAWNITPHDARAWLMRVSQRDIHKLVFAIDGLEPSDEATRQEIEDLTSPAFGSGIHLIVALDEGSAERMSRSPNRLSASAIGRRARYVHLEPLDDREFQIAREVLDHMHIGFTPGANFAREYRQPWVMRAVVAPAVKAVQALQGNHLSASPALPPLLGIDLIEHVRQRFFDPELRRMYSALAKAVLHEAQDRDRPTDLALDSLDVHVVRRDTLKLYVETHDMDYLLERGFLRPSMHASDLAVVIIRMPELLASELAKQCADKIASLAKEDARKAATWLAAGASNLPIGDIVMAQALLDASRKPGGIPPRLLKTLMETPPERAQLVPGTKFAMNMPGVGMIEMTLRDHATAIVEMEGKQHLLELESDGLGETYENVYPWLILSHLAAAPLVIANSGQSERIDRAILLRVGSCDIILRKPSGDPERDAIPTHELEGVGSIACHQAGIVEPITYSIFCFLLKAPSVDADEWIDLAVAGKSLPLMARIHIALLQLANAADKELANWAATTLANKLLPAFDLKRLHSVPSQE